MKTCLVLALSIRPPDYPELQDIFSPHHIEFRPNPLGRMPTEDELIEMMKDIDGVIAGSEPYNMRVLESAPKLKIIARLGVGYDSVDIKAATEKGVVVTWTPISELAISVAEETFALILSVLRMIPYRDREMRKGRYDISISTADAFSLTLGILGLGRIGLEVAKRAKAFQMKLLYYDSARKMNSEREIGIQYVSFDSLLKEADIISIHVPHTAETDKLIGQRELSLMKRNAYVINTARGGIVDEDALLKALKNKRIGGAPLGVFSQEPPTEKHPFYSIGSKLPNLVLVPHMAVGPLAKNAMMRAAAGDIIAVLEGGKPKYPLNCIS